MARIIISELYPYDSEGLMSYLDAEDSRLIYGGDKSSRTYLLKFAAKVLDFVIILFAIDTIVELVNSYADNISK